MKNALLIWNIVLTLLVGYLLIGRFTGKKKSEVKSGDNVTGISGDSTQMRIAFFEMDSVAAKFEEVKQLKSELAKKEEDNNKELASLTQQYRNRFEYYQEKAENGTLTEAQSVTAQQEIQQMEENIKNRKLQLEQEYNSFYMQRQNDIKSKIESFVKDLNKERGYTYVVSDDPGLFYYKDPRHNITSEVIAGLNRLYPPKKTTKP